MKLIVSFCASIIESAFHLVCDCISELKGMAFSQQTVLAVFLVHPQIKPIPCLLYSNPSSSTHPLWNLDPSSEEGLQQ